MKDFGPADTSSTARALAGLSPATFLGGPLGASGGTAGNPSRRVTEPRSGQDPFVARPRPPQVPPPRKRRVEATIHLPVLRENIFILESFIDSLEFAGPTERSRLKLAGSEIFDNLVKHSSPIEGGLVTIRAARRKGTLFLIFGFKSPTFADYAARCSDYEPVFDHHARRWHGMGLRMTRNLSSSLSFRAGNLLDRVIIRF